MIRLIRSVWEVGDTSIARSLQTLFKEARAQGQEAVLEKGRMLVQEL
jgi:hypothetical protein